ncbi:unnamed protein product [Prunus brigantina]
MPSTIPFLLFPFCPFSFSVCSQRTYRSLREREFIVDFELAGWGAAMEDFRSILEMLWWPLIFVWGVELQIQQPFGLLNCLFAVIISIVSATFISGTLLRVLASFVFGWYFAGSDQVVRVLLLVLLSKSCCNPTFVLLFLEVLDSFSDYRTVRDKFEQGFFTPLKITLLGRQPNGNKQYEQPTCDEIGGLIVGDIGLFDSNRDIVIEFKDGGLKRITKLNPKFMSLQYPILFPYGEDGYTPDLKWNNGYKGRESKRGRIPMRAFIAYQIQERAPQLDTLLKGGRLFQQFLVDAYATLEEDRLDYIRKNQKNLRSEVYKGIYDAISKGDNDANNIGQRVILPSSYTGSARYMVNNYQDAMAICRQYGHPDLFITFTCNIKWPEIVREFDKKPGYKPEDRPDVVSRVFKMKLDDMINYIRSGKPFGETEAAADIDSIISAELPDKIVDPVLHDIVNQFMIHGPYGEINPNSPCMREGKCSKNFPKQFKSETILEKMVGNGRLETKCEIYIQNIRKEDVRITLWGDTARAFDFQALEELAPPIIAVFTSLKVKQFLGKTVLNSSVSTMIFIDPDIQELDTYRMTFGAFVDAIKMVPPSIQPIKPEELETAKKLSV